MFTANQDKSALGLPEISATARVDSSFDSKLNQMKQLDFFFIQIPPPTAETFHKQPTLSLKYVI